MDGQLLLNWGAFGRNFARSSTILATRKLSSLLKKFWWKVSELSCLFVLTTILCYQTPVMMRWCVNGVKCMMVGWPTIFELVIVTYCCLIRFETTNFSYFWIILGAVELLNYQLWLRGSGYFVRKIKNTICAVHPIRWELKKVTLAPILFTCSWKPTRNLEKNPLSNANWS